MIRNSGSHVYFWEIMMDWLLRDGSGQVSEKSNYDCVFVLLSNNE